MNMLKIAVVMALITSGCLPGHGTGKHTWEQAKVRLRIFEVPPDVVDSIIPKETRKPLNDSTYVTAEASAEIVSSLLDGMAANPGLLHDQKRPIRGWSSTRDQWICCKADKALQGTSHGEGSPGVRIRDGVREIRLEYNVTHTIDVTPTNDETEPATKGTLPIEEKIYYEGPVPPDKIIIFMKPFVRSDGTELVHLLVFEVVKWEKPYEI